MMSQRQVRKSLIGSQIRQATRKQIRQRLVDILDSTLFRLTRDQKQIGLNEALLEEWTLLLQEILIPFAPTNTAKSPPFSIPTIPLPQPDLDLLPTQPLLTMHTNAIHLYSFPNPTPQKMQFKSGLLRRFSSWTFKGESVVLVGGSRHSNPNLKSKDILRLDIPGKNLKKVGELPQGLSSQAAVLVGDWIYLVGGYRDHNVVTRGCWKYHSITHQVQPLPSLNFPSASHSCILWNKQIYKVGGIGECFGQFDLSPYIERYSFSDLAWQVINPQVPTSLSNCTLLVRSLLYVSTEGDLVVLGGYDFAKNGQNTFLTIHHDSTDLHTITAVGVARGVKPGGFWSQCVLQEGQPFALAKEQATHDSILALSPTRYI